MSEPRRKHSLSVRLARMNLLLSFAVLLLAAIAFFTYDLVTYRSNLIANLQAQAEMVGDSSTSSLLFNDPQSAESTLQSLQNAPNVLGAVIRTDKGPVFAKYGAVSPPQGAAIHTLKPGEANRWWPSTNSRILLAHRVTFEGRTIGVVYILASLQEIHARAVRYILISLGILVLCMIAGLLIGSASQRWLSGPIRGLAETATKVAKERDYSLRAHLKPDSTELGTLVDAFNGMLGQIEERDVALRDARDRLEARVEERTTELRAANQELESFSHTVAHDLRGPLDSAAGIVYLLEHSSGVAEDAMSREMLEQLKASTENMSNLIDDLLNFARASTTSMKREPVDMSAIAREIAADLRRSEPGRNVHVVVHELPKVEADAGLVRIVIDNLLRNAWKYTSNHEKACIEFGGKVVGEGMIYFVRDDGAGFDASRKDSLFEPFQRLHSKSEFPGTGIGLATVQRILQRMGGTIWAEGVVEVGAAFYFTVGPE